MRSFYASQDFTILQSDICIDCGHVFKHCQCAYEAHFGDDFEPQSGVVSDINISSVPKMSAYQNVEFADTLDPYLYDVDSVIDPTRRLQDSSDATLEKFFSRPIKIHEHEWATGATMGFNIDPWSLYWNNPRVVNRITNYNLLRCTLRVKVLINGNGFQYGRALVAYQPFEIYDDLSVHDFLVPNDLVGTSQLPRIFLDPTTSTGGEFKLPMFAYRNYIDIPGASWSEMGKLLFRAINTLKHANGAADRATISVFAWAEDVAMSVLTSTEPSTLTPQFGVESDDMFVPQAGEIDEANSKGVVSGPATTVAKWAGYLSKVPYIGPFALATQMAASTTASIAKIFGYCRPPVTKNPEPYRPTPMSSLALTNVPDTSQKMTLDHKQELSIDPRLAGLGSVDPLCISEIAKRESYVYSFPWAVGVAPETLLFNSRVTPVLWRETTGPPTIFHLPACAFAALPFQYWTGTMRFRFQIVCSTFHKGRLKIVYDPQYLKSNEYNTNYLRIVDIAEEQDFTIEVGPGQTRSLLSHHYPGIDLPGTVLNTNPFAAAAAGNGVLSVYVLNELTIPNSVANNDIQINVFVSMCDDFEVFVPEDHFQKFVFKPQMGLESDFEPQMGEEIVPESQNTMEPNAPVHSMTQAVVGPDSAPSADLNKVFAGEVITSFRTLLKRYNLWNTIPAVSGTGVVIYGRNPHFPYLRGNVPGSVDVTAALASYNYVNTVLLHWVRNAFSGWRGSIRYKLVPRGYQNTADSVMIQRAPLKPGTSSYSYNTIPTPTYTSWSDAREDIVMRTSQFGVPNAGSPFSGVNGQVITFNSINGVMEFEMPYYSPNRFSPGKKDDYTSGIDFECPWDYRISLAAGNTATYDVHVAAGEDFQTYFFTGLPRIYYEATPPAV